MPREATKTARPLRAELARVAADPVTPAVVRQWLNQLLRGEQPQRAVKKPARITVGK